MWRPIVLLSLLYVVLAAHDCTPACVAYSGQFTDSPDDAHCIAPCDVSITFQFVPCDLAVTQLQLAYESDSMSSTGASQLVSCGASGSGTQLIVSTPMDIGGNTVMSWTYAEGNHSYVCDVALKSAAIDAGLTLLAFSIIVPNGAMRTFNTRLADSVVACDSVVVAAFDAPECFNNIGNEYLLPGITDPSTQLMVGWKFASVFDGSSATSAKLIINGVATTAAQPRLTCTFNVGVALVQLFDAASNKWAISWTYNSYTTCDTLMTAIADGSDVAPSVESAVVVTSVDTYAWQRTTNTVRLSQWRVDCSGSPSPAPSTYASASPTPTPSPTPSPSPVVVQLTQPVSPYINCMTVPAHGLCVVEFGYYNPNSVAITLVAGSMENQLVRSESLFVRGMPSVFLPGENDNVMRVEYPCTRNGNPVISWKLRTRVPNEIAAQLDVNNCASECLPDTMYSVEYCSLIATQTWPDEDATLPTTPVMRCVMAKPGNFSDCFISA